MATARVMVAAAAVLLLAGCATAPAPAENVAAPSPSPTATPTPTPTPVPTVITLNSDSVLVADQNGCIITTLDYFDRGIDLAATLTETFGFPPAVEVVAPKATDFGFQGTKYDWEGFILYWQYGYEDDPTSGVSEPPYSYRSMITTTVAAVRGIAVQSTDGVQVGDGQGDLSTLYPGQTVIYHDPDGVEIETAFVTCVTLPSFENDSPDENGGEPMNCVAIRAAPSDGPITGIQAPAKLHYGM